MARNNDKPVPCRSCRFQQGGVCLRNPPSAVNIKGQIVAFFPQVLGGVYGCFAGERGVFKTCGTCVGHQKCSIWNGIQTTTYAGSVEDRNCDGWHCSDWKGEEDVKE
jgi:hypothetical protein